MSDVECRKLNCPNNDGAVYKDSHGRDIGYCKLEEIMITRFGRCENDSSD